MYYNQNQWFQLSILIIDSAVSALVFMITGLIPAGKRNRIDEYSSLE